MSYPLIVGNWKMNGKSSSLAEIKVLANSGSPVGVKMVVCPPATLLNRISEQLQGTGIHTGAQNCHWATHGAHTGEISAEMLADAGAKYVILGHSERRSSHGETGHDIQLRIGAAWRAGLLPILCVGEKADERAGGQAGKVVRRQLSQAVPDEANGSNLVLAYEPVWAIGSGQSADLATISKMHGEIRRFCIERFGEDCGCQIQILYGGSVHPENSGEILKTQEVGGALIGGASLSAADFLGIANSISRRA